jgi:hypothetical protein
MSKRQIQDYLQDILDAIDAAESFVEGMTFEDFQNDQKTIFAVTRAIEIIGEAAKSIPISWREQYSQVPWKNITGMRVEPPIAGRVLKDTAPHKGFPYRLLTRLLPLPERRYWAV